ncbi:MAG: transposase [Clostridiaceae bacterium]|nr:transposase [Clostridiaceae bacterium]
MSREARKKSESGIYHIVLRGHNRETIFKDDEDREKFLQTLERYKKISKYKLYGYCIMGDHVHLLLHEQDESLDKIMRRIGASYVYWYNFKYKRYGQLFYDRYKSEAVETLKYFLTVLRFIHNNPKKAGLVDDISEYKWSSYNDYINNEGITDKDFALMLMGDDYTRAVEEFVNFHAAQTEDKCLDMEYKLRLTDEEAKEIIKKECRIKDTLELKNFDKEKRKALIRQLKDKGISTRQLERLTGINRLFILKA